MDENIKNKIMKDALDKRNGKIKITWSKLNEKYNCAFNSGESLRCWIKQQLKKSGELPSHKEKISKDIKNKLNEADLKIIELKKEQKRVQTIKLEYNKILRESSRQELLFDEVKSSIKSTEPPIFTPIIKTINEEKIGVAGISDIHFGKIFQSLTNKYSEEIVYERMNTLINKIVNICKEQKINKIIIINSADSIEGMCLRINQLQNLSIGIVDMTIRFAKFMSEWLNTLSKYLYIDYYHVSECNHSQIRPLGTKANQFPKEDMEKIIMTYIHDVLKNNNRIKIHMFNDDFIEFKIFNYNVIAKQGHNIKNYKNIIKDLSMQHRKFYDYCYLGHVHHGESVTVSEGNNNNCEVLIIPSIMGSDEYSDRLMLGAKAGARLDIYTPQDGRIIGYNIKLN